MSPPVSYQSMLGGEGDARPGTVFVRLGEGAIRTRRKDAAREVSVSLSKAQMRWLREAEELSGRGIDQSAVVRALVDLGMELEVDWAVLAGGGTLRDTVRQAVMVRRAGGPVAPGPRG